MKEYVGLDVSKQETSYCIRDGEGNVIAPGKSLSDPFSLFEVLKEYTRCPQRISGV